MWKGNIPLISGFVVVAAGLMQLVLRNTTLGAGMVVVGAILVVQRFLISRRRAKREKTDA